jgi:hypothetical protein
MDSIRFMGILLLLYYFQIHLHHLLAHFHLEIVLCGNIPLFLLVRFATQMEISC